MAAPNDPPGGAEGKARQDIKRAEDGLQRAEGELRAAEQELEAARDELQDAKHLITIIVDGVDREVRPGKWIVSQLKAELKIDPAKVLAKITPQGLEDLDDNKEIELHEREQFMTHARSGGSS
jgi:hypothetical protein